MPATCPYHKPDQSSPCPAIPLLKIHLNINIPSTPGSYKWSLSPRFPYLYAPLLPPMRATCPAPLILLDLITRMIFAEVYRSLSSSICCFHHSPVTSTLLGLNIPLSTLFSNTLSLHFFLNVNDQVSHPYKTTDKIIVLYIILFIFLDMKLEDKIFCTKWYQAFPDFSPALNFFQNRT